MSEYMEFRNVIKTALQTIGCTLYACFALLASQQPAFANACFLPVLSIIGMEAWFAAVVGVILLESVFAKTMLRLSWPRSLYVSFVANLSSALAGILLTGILTTAWGLSHAFLDDNAAKMALIADGQMGSKVAQCLVDGSAMIVALIICVPFLLLSVFSERFVAGKMLRVANDKSVNAWAWRANLASYLMLALIAGGAIGADVIGYARVVTDETHRPVDAMSADRLWELAVKRMREEQLRATGRAFAYQKTGDHTDDLSIAARYARNILGDSPKAERLLEEAEGIIDTHSKQPPSFDRTTWLGVHVHVLSMLSDLYCSQNRYHEAVPLLEKAVQIAHETKCQAEDSYRINLAIAYAKTGDFKKADDALSIIPKTALTGYDMADYNLAKGDLSSAEQFYATCVRNESRISWSTRCHKRLVEIYCKEKRYSEAEKLVLKDIKNANDIDKSNAQDDIVPPTFSRAAPFFALLGDVYLDEGKPSEAEQCYKSALRGDTTLQRAATGLARVADLEHLPDSARIWRERAKSAPSYNWEMTMTLDEHI